jgi:hypothetical protein
MPCGESSRASWAWAACCTLNLMMMRPIFTAFGEQVKPKDGAKGAGGAGVLRVGYMVHYLIDLEPDTWRDWAKKNGLA